MKIPFSPPFIDEDVKREVLETLNSGWITSGPKVKALEELVAKEVGLGHVVCCNSATSGLMLMLHWFGVKPGDEVIIPAYTYAATALVVLHAGAIPVMVDTGTDLNIDVARIREKITARTKVIIPVDIAGLPCRYRDIQDIVNAADVRKMFKPENENQRVLSRIMILADAAHSLGAAYEGRPAAQWSDFTVFSFHAVKNITTAEGGAVCINLPDVFDSRKVYADLKLWTLNGQTKDAFTKTTVGGWRYDIVYPGFKINMPDLCAAIGLAQLRKYTSEILPQRKRVFDQYLSAFSRYLWVETPVQTTGADGASSFHLFALRIKGISENQRDRIIDEISKTGVAVNVHFQPLPLLTIFKDRGYNISDYPMAYDNYSREISLPIYPELDEMKIDYIVSAVVKSFQSVVYDKATI